MRLPAKAVRPGGAGVLTLLLLCGPGAGVVRGQVLDLPPRPTDAPGGAAIAADVRLLDLEAREERLFAEFARGNIPPWLRSLERVELKRRLHGTDVLVTVWVTPDYLAVGSGDDWFLTPLTPQTALRIAGLTRASLPTPPIVDAVWAAARVRLDPVPLPPGPAMTTVPVFEEHNRRIRAQRASEAAPPDALVAGHKKDVVLTGKLDPGSGKVAIYGWHRADGTAIQPLYTGHTDRWVDYSHGVRLVSRGILIDGAAHDLLEVLRDPALAGLLSDDGVIDLSR